MTALSALRELAEEMRDITGYDSGVADSAGNLLACTSQETISTLRLTGSRTDGPWVEGGRTYLRTQAGDGSEYVLFTFDTSPNAGGSLRLAAMAISSRFAELRRSDKPDRQEFVRRVLLGEAGRDELYRGAKLHKIQFDKQRTAILISVTGAEPDPNVADVVRNIFSDRGKFFVIEIDPRRTVVAAELKEPHTDDLEAVCRTVLDTINAELMVKAVVSSGNPAPDLEGLARSFREAQMAYEIGRVFLDHETILFYNKLGLGRLVYQLPQNLCDLFLDEIFHGHGNEVLDSEMLVTVNNFFENSLNISETARQLYVHRNTVLYRLERLYKATGLDIKQFEDAILLKIALMVKRYKEIKELHNA